MGTTQVCYVLFRKKPAPNTSPRSIYSLYSEKTYGLNRAFPGDQNPLTVHIKTTSHVLQLKSLRTASNPEMKIIKLN